MINKKGFVISTTLYSIFGVMLIIVFYILYLLANNRISLTSTIDNIKESFKDNNSDKIVLYKDPSGANPPILATGMIPVIYNKSGDKWIIADISESWYNYNEQHWANAVKVSNYSNYLNEDGELKIGEQVSMYDITSMWVWIPRFKYKIPNSIGSSSLVSSPPLIDILFENGTNSTGVDAATYKNGISSTGINTNYYTHPAFRDGTSVYNTVPYDLGGWDEELTGFWVGKFRTGGTKNDPKIKPDINGKVENVLNMKDAFLSSLIFAGGSSYMIDDASDLIIENNHDSHLMKNIEWGAVTYLSHSIYGIGQNQICVNNSGSYLSGIITGRSSGEIDASNDTNEGTYKYDGTCVGSNCINADLDRINDLSKGTCASTTGNIYGIYDLSSNLGAERMMANNRYYNAIQKYGSSGFYYGSEDYATISYCTDAELNVEPLVECNSGTYDSNEGYWPERKYYDFYQNYEGYTSDGQQITKEYAILGDATWETLNWYKESYGTFQHWFARRSNPGVFSFLDSGGSLSMSDGDSFHVVLIP